MSLASIIWRVLEDVPNYSEFMFVRELYESSRRLLREYGDVAELVEVGLSRAGLPIEALIIHGGDERRVLAIGFPHPNEPIGSLALEFLSWRLARDREFLKLFNATWIIVKVADVYGALLNEGWFKGVFDVEKYALNYYRPPGYKQVEWSFPVEYKSFKWIKPVEETRAIMKLIDEWKPTHIYSLHNSGFTGTYYYVSRALDDRDRVEILKTVPRRLRVPLHRGEPEAPFMRKLDEAIFKMPGIAEYYDWLEENLRQDPSRVIDHGGSSFDYASKINPNVFELVCEVPYIYDYRLDIDISIGIPRRDILTIALERRKNVLRSLEEVTEKIEVEVGDDNPFYEALSYFIRTSKRDIEATENWLKVAPELNVSASLAQAFNSYLNVIWSSILLTGLLYRMAEFEISRGVSSLKLSDIRSWAVSTIKRFIGELNSLSDYYVVQPRRTVSIQVASIIATLL